MGGFWWQVFLKALDETGQNLVWSGIVTFVGLLVVGIRAKWNLAKVREHVKENILVALLIGGIALAPFMVAAPYHLWKENSDRAAAAERKLDQMAAPRIAGEVNTTAVAPGGPKGLDALVTIIATLRNTGAPSVLEDLGVTVAFSDGRTIAGTQVRPKFGFTTLSGDQSLALRSEDYLPRKSISQPIPTGGAAQGWYMALLQGATKDDVLKSGTVYLTFRDVMGRQYTITGMPLREIKGLKVIGIDEAQSKKRIEPRK
jgi:hypothetical protein